MNKKIAVFAKGQVCMYVSFIVVAIILFMLTSYYTEFNPFLIIENGEMIWEFITEDFLPPKLPGKSRIEGVISSVFVTITLALLSTSLAAIIAFFVSLFGSEKVSPFPKFAKIVRGFATFLRNIPALVWAFILFSSLGIGTGVGFTALFITSFAFMIRAFVETIEDVSQDCVESLQAVGASFPQRVAQAILPSCINGFLAWYLYCIEVNIRASTIVGMVGGGGVGLTLFTYIKGFQYDVALSIIILIAIMVIIVDRVTSVLKKQIETNDKFIPGFMIVVLIANMGSILYLQIDWAKLISRIPRIGEVFLELAKFDFTKFDLVFSSMLETISIAVLSLLYSLAMGIIFGMLASRNIFKNKWLSIFIQSFFTFLRAVPTVVWVLLMLVCLGMGPEAGIAGLCVHTTAFFTKVFAQSFESIPNETIEALEVTGTTRLSVFVNAVIPTVFAQIVAWTGMRLETNFSECASLGMVGAGGIGFIISRHIQGYEYGTAGVAIVFVFFVAYSIERIFVIVKKKIA